MKKENKKMLIELLTEKYEKYASFRFRKVGDITNNHFNIRTKEVVLKQTAESDTVAHEIAHAIQFFVRNDTDCGSNGGWLAREHLKVEGKIYNDLKNNGIAKAWNGAVGWSVNKDWK